MSSDWFTAQIILTADRIVPQNLPASNRDLDLTFFREELQFSEAEIDLARQSAINFFQYKVWSGLLTDCPQYSRRTCFPECYI